MSLVRQLILFCGVLVTVRWNGRDCLTGIDDEDREDVVTAVAAAVDDDDDDDDDDNNDDVDE
jgi:hypothetical protein